MSDQRIITISDVKHWDDGGISIKTQAGNWCKPSRKLAGFDWDSMKGQNITASLWKPEGKNTTYITDFKPADGRQPIPQAATAPQSAPVHVRPPAPADDRTNSIIAQTLCKTVSFNSVQEALAGYQWLVEALSGEVVLDGPDPVMHAGDPGQHTQAPNTEAGDPGFSDDIPF